MRFYKFWYIYAELHRLHIPVDDIAKQMGMSASTFRRKLTGSPAWTLPEMYRLTELLGSSVSEWDRLFPNVYEEVGV